MSSPMGTGYACGVCGSRVLMITAVYSGVRAACEWVLRCGTGHVLIPTPGDYLTFQFEDVVR